MVACEADWIGRGCAAKRCWTARLATASLDVLYIMHHIHYIQRSGAG